MPFNVKSSQRGVASSGVKTLCAAVIRGQAIFYNPVSHNTDRLVLDCMLSVDSMKTRDLGMRLFLLLSVDRVT